MFVARKCAARDCDAKTLRDYCVRCEINGDAAKDFERRENEKAVQK